MERKYKLDLLIVFTSSQLVQCNIMLRFDVLLQNMNLFVKLDVISKSTYQEQNKLVLSYANPFLNSSVLQ